MNAVHMHWEPVPFNNKHTHFIFWIPDYHGCYSLIFKTYIKICFQNQFMDAKISAKFNKFVSSCPKGGKIIKPKWIKSQFTSQCCANCLASYLYFIQSYRTTDIWTTEEYLKVPWIPKIIIYIIQLIWDLLYEFLLIDQSIFYPTFLFSPCSTV